MSQVLKFVGQETSIIIQPRVSAFESRPHLMNFAEIRKDVLVIPHTGPPIVAQIACVIVLVIIGPALLSGILLALQIPPRSVPLWLALTLGFGLGGLLSVAVLFLVRVFRLDREIRIDRDGLTYKISENEQIRFDWDEITIAGRVESRQKATINSFIEIQSKSKKIRIAYNEGFPFFNSKFAFYSPAYFENDEGIDLLTVLLNARLQERFSWKGRTEKGYSGMPPYLRQTAKLFEQWGEYKEAERVMRAALKTAPIWDNHNLPVYLDEYAAYLRKNGRGDIADEIEARLPERLNKLTVAEHNIGKYLKGR